MEATTRMHKILEAPAATLEQVDAILEGRATLVDDAGLKTVTLKEAANRLGVSRPTVYRIVKSGDLDTVLIGGLERIPVRALTAYATRSVRRVHSRTR